MSNSKLDAEYYNNNSSRQKLLASNILPLHNFKPDEHILDIGCGDGALSSELATCAPQGTVLGIDLSKEMINFAKQKFPQNQFKNLSFTTISAEDIDFINQYSLVTAFNSIYWIKNLAKTFNNVYNALHANGRMLALIYPRESPYWDLFIQTFKKTEFSKWYDLSICPTMLTTEEYIDLVIKCGFNVLCADTFIEAPRSYANKEEFKKYVNGWLPCLLPAPENILHDYLDAVTEFAWSKYGNHDGIANIPYKKLHLYIKK